MPPRIPLRPLRPSSALLQRGVLQESHSVCFFCSLSSKPRAETARRRPKKRALLTRRFESTVAPTARETAANGDPRKQLEAVLLELQKHATNYVNLSRLGLALHGLRQKPGHESIRVAVLALKSGSDATATAKEVLKLILADPLVDKQKWEQELDRREDLPEPMIIRVGAEEDQAQGAIALAKGNLLREVKASSPMFNGHGLEMLLMETNPFMPAEGAGAREGFEESVLVPTVDIPTSSDGRYSPITTPVHRTLVVANGIMGAASVASMPTLESPNVLASAVDIPEYKPDPTTADVKALPFVPIDVRSASKGVDLMRSSVQHAMEYERLWFRSNIFELVKWLKADVTSTTNNTTKPPVRDLIASLLRRTSAAIEAEENRALSVSLSAAVSPTSLGSLHKNLEGWAESAHTELQEQLDLAFASRRWRKLGWWKLFWRVDDVGMLTNDILAQRFLPKAERSAIYLAGRMEEAGVPLHSSATHPTTTASPGKTSADNLPLAPNWPANIPATRDYLQAETVPALQALAQKLVLQALSTSGFTSALGALVYVGTLSTSAYEAGAVAALGIVFALRQMQARWETAREFWEGEVREEGRKAVRGVEGVVADALERQKRIKQETTMVDAQADRSKAKSLVARAQELLEKMK
ncbi:hypothetical protein F4780DRAFT_728858 [Xylariomycetidae sp. FL0641]|nr:hypothetical protein F4780DRAFT_728858 [Xylariomycetidae sp. FL0641]